LLARPSIINEIVAHTEIFLDFRTSFNDCLEKVQQYLDFDISGFALSPVNFIVTRLSDNVALTTDQLEGESSSLPTCFLLRDDPGHLKAIHIDDPNENYEINIFGNNEAVSSGSTFDFYLYHRLPTGCVTLLEYILVPTNIYANARLVLGPDTMSYPLELDQNGDGVHPLDTVIK
jgi:hypothetical protein